MMESKNLSYMFYKEYYDEVKNKDESDIAKVNEQIFGTTFPDMKKEYFPDAQRFYLKVIYPGLMMGLGYPHEAKRKNGDKFEDIKGQIISGFSLDYVTGMPVLPGSSVKGALRSAFAHEEYIKDILKEIKVEVPENIDVKKLTKEIFGSKKEDDEHFPGTDIFFDAYPVVKADTKILGKENITPHGDDVFKSPVPLTLMKLKPGTILEFSFLLHDSSLLIANEKMELFKWILCDLGIGAKTNVGFGILDEATSGEVEAVCKIDDGTTCPKCGRKKSPKYEICKACSDKEKSISANSSSSAAFTFGNIPIKRKR